MSEDGVPDALVAVGKELLTAIADVSSKAGKSIVRGVARLSEAQFAPYVARKRTQADAICTEGDINRARALIEERRKQEVDEIYHEAAREMERLLVQQRVKRLQVQLAREEANFQSIVSQSLRITEQDPDRSKARDIEDDWIFKFANYAQEIFDKDVQELWSRILSSAAIEERMLLSPASLQAMSLLHKLGASDFDKFCRVIFAFGFYPLVQKSFDHETQGIDLRNLREVGLIVEDSQTSYSFRDFDLQQGEIGYKLTFSHAQLALTQRGSQIASAVFGARPMPLSEEIQEKYIRAIVSDQKRKKWPFKIIPKQSDASTPFVVLLRDNSSANFPDDNAEVLRLVETYDLSKRVRWLLKWAAEQFSLTSFPPTP